MNLPSRTVGLLLAAACVLTPAAPAAAVMVLLKHDPTPVFGFLVEQSDTRLVVREEAEGGYRRRVIRLEDVEEVVATVSAERLASLRPDRPEAYRDYAEELAEKQRDPEARAAAERLYLIAAYLAPQRLGPSCLLGMAAVTGDETRRRALTALARMLAGRRPVSGPPAAESERSGRAASGGGEALLQAVRLLRQGRRTAAARLLARPGVDEALRRAGVGWTGERLREACRPPKPCDACQEGAARCPVCGGRGVDPEAGGRSPCPACEGTGRVICPVCGGDYRRIGPPRALLAELIRLELRLTASEDAPDEGRWSAAAAAGLAPVPVLQLERIGPADPRRCVYRDGRWVAP